MQRNSYRGVLAIVATMVALMASSCAHEARPVVYCYGLYGPGLAALLHREVIYDGGAPDALETGGR